MVTLTTKNNFVPFNFNRFFCSEINQNATPEKNKNKIYIKDLEEKKFSKGNFYVKDFQEEIRKVLPSAARFNKMSKKKQIKVQEKLDCLFIQERS